MSAPILITGLPRSGTSLVAGIFALCGAWTGDTKPADPWNRKGNFENAGLQDRFVKAYLALAGADPLGLDPLPPLGAAPLVAPEVWREQVLVTLDELGVFTPRRSTDPSERIPNRIWLFKDAKLALAWRQWAAAFPEARWVVVGRRRDGVVASALRAEPMARRLGYDWARWKSWAAAYLARVEDLKAGVEAAAEVWPDRDVFEDLTRMKPVVERLGLTWRPELVADFVDARLWHEAAGDG